VKGFREHQPDMNPRRVLHFLWFLSASFYIIYIDMEYIDINITL